MRNFSEKLKKYIVTRILSIPGRIICMFKGYTTVGGLKLPLYEYSKTSRSLLLRGRYEDAEVDFIKKYIPRGAFVVEFGASIGVVSCHILKKTPIMLLSFEAVGDWVKLASKTVGLNFKNPSYRLNEIAIGKVGQKEVSFLFDPQENLGGQSQGAKIQNTNRRIITVPALSLFDVNKIYSVPRNAYLVMDIEGAEWDIAKNQKDALGIYEGVIVECHSVMDGNTNVTPQEIMNEFKRCGFDLVESIVHHTHVVAFFLRAHSRGSLFPGNN